VGVGAGIVGVATSAAGGSSLGGIVVIGSARGGVLSSASGAMGVVGPSVVALMTSVSVDVIVCAIGVVAGAPVAPFVLSVLATATVGV